MEIIGKGIFTWNGSERRSDRYGTFVLSRSNYHDDAFAKVGWNDDLRKLVGTRCSIEVKVVEARESGHIGDIFRGIFPTMPVVGEVIDLGTGLLFFTPEDWDEGPVQQVGLTPDDGRGNDWFDPNKLYRLHDQTVEVTIRRV